jgi:hypothetical protein
MPGVNFDPGTSTTHFDRPFGSPNGNWILTALTDIVATTMDEIVLVNGAGSRAPSTRESGSTTQATGPTPRTSPRRP